MKENTQSNSNPKSPPNGVNKEVKVKKPRARKEPAILLHEQTVANNPDCDVIVSVGQEYSDSHIRIETRQNGTAKLMQGIALGLAAAISLTGIAIAVDKRRRELATDREPLEVSED